MNSDWKDLGQVDRPLALQMAERLGRRRFMGTMMTAAVSLAAALAGRPLPAAAQSGLVSVACCNLCQAQSSGCSGVCCWTWECCAHDGHVWFCKECYSSRNSGCSGGCASLKCSQATHTGNIC